MAGASSLRVIQVALRNYKSVEQCEIELHPLTVLVGRNGAGKSNIIDALRFVADSLQNTLEYAIRERGGISQVRRKSLGGRPTHPGIGLRLQLDDGVAEYSFQLASTRDEGFRVDGERCAIKRDSGEQSEFHTRDGEVVAWTPSTPAPECVEDRLFLVALSGIPEFRPVFDVLTRMTFHNLNPEVMKAPQRPEPGERLAHDGRNLASVIRNLQAKAPGDLARVTEYLRAVGVPVTRVAHKKAGSLETVEVTQEMAVGDAMRPIAFDAVALSDGTIRSLGILVSLASTSVNGKAAHGPSLIGIEEPETALHPAAAGALMEALLEGAERTQILVSCHSPDLIDHGEVAPEMIRVVLVENGRTVVGPLSPAKQQLLRDHLHTPGELLRIDQLTPDPEEIRRQGEAKGTLFEALA